jgi:DNA-directed RNA polymerase
LSSIKPADLTTAYEALTRLAESDPELGFIAEELAALQDMRQAEQEMMAREVIPEVKPVLESEGRNLLTKKREEADAQAAGVGESDMSLDGEGSDARFAVRNLRSTLEKLQDIKRHPRERQMELEHASYEAAKEELAYSAELLSQQKTAASAQEDQKLQRQKLQGWMYQWLGQLKTQLSDDIFALRSKLDSTAAEGLDLDKDKHTFTDLGWGSTGMKDNALALYLTLLPVDKLAIITVIEIMRQCGGHGVADGMKALRAMLAVGKAVETEYRAETIRSVAGVDSAHWQRTLDPQTQKPSQLLVGKVWKKLGKQVDPSSAAGQPSKVGAGRQEWTDWKASEKAAAQALEKTQEDDLKAVWTPPWSQMAHLGVGSFLVQRLLQTAKVERTAFDPETDEEV